MITSAEFVKSSTELNQCPSTDMPEMAFIGRSNVGKSSLINLITGVKGLAKTSGKPGKTQTINHFLVNESWYLVDLPGYGYASVSKKERAKWSKFIDAYILGRPNLYNLYLLIDARHNPQKIDLEFIDFLGANQVPFTIVFTKADKLKKSVLAKNLQIYNSELEKSWEIVPNWIVTSSTNELGKAELLEHISAIVE